MPTDKNHTTFVLHKTFTKWFVLELVLGLVVVGTNAQVRFFGYRAFVASAAIIICDLNNIVFLLVFGIFLFLQCSQVGPLLGEKSP